MEIQEQIAISTAKIAMYARSYVFVFVAVTVLIFSSSSKYYFCQIQSNTVTLQLSPYYLFLVYNSLREESGHVSRIRAILL